MRRPLLLAGLLLLIAAALFFLFDSGMPGDDQDSAAAAARAELEAATADAAAPPAAGTPPSAQAPAVGRSELRTEPVPAATTQAHEGPWLEIEVVRGAAELPAPHAVVSVLTPDEGRQLSLMMSFLTGISVPELLATEGETHHADAAGKLRVPLPRDHGIIAAELGEEFVLSEWTGELGDDQNQSLRLLLEPSRTLQVLVVDLDGRPLPGAPVSIRFGDENFQFDFLRDRTGADGIARMKHVSAFLRSFSPGPEMPCSVALTCPLPEPVATTFDVDDPPDEAIRLVMPTHGRLEVEARHASGAPVEDGLVVFVSTPRETSEDDDDFFIPGLPGFDSIAVRTAGGVASFDYVGLGMEYEATAVFPEAPEASRARARGPVRAGESVRMVLTESLEFPFLTGRLLGPDGQPLVERDAELRIPEESNEFGMEQDRTLTTGADGSFRIAMRSTEMIPIPQAAEFWLTGAVAEETLLASFEIPPLRVGENLLGDLHARPAPVLAAGRVLDADGAPLAGATVCRMRWIQWDEDDPTNGQWLEDWGKEVACGEDGGFVLHGSPSAHGLRLLAEAPTHLRKEIEAAPGARGLEIRLEAGGALRGRILADPGIPLDELVLTLIAPGSDPEDDGQHWGSIADDGSFEFEGLPPGLATLTVSASWGDDEAHAIARVDGLAIGPGAAPDPRLDPIDLRGRLHVCVLRVSAQDGTELEEVQAWRADAPDATFHGWNGEITVLSSQPLGRLIVSASGFRNEEFEVTRAELDVVLRRGPEILLRVQPSAARVDDVVLGVMLVPAEQGARWSDQPRGFFATDGSLRLHVQQPGTYRAIFLAVRGEVPEENRWGFSWIRPEEGEDYAQLTVADAGGVQSFALAPPSAERLREAVDEE